MSDFVPYVVSQGARDVLDKRYYCKSAGETEPDHVWKRASLGVERFYRLMADGLFFPNSPTLFNAGTDHGGTLSACFVFNISDSLNGDWPGGGKHDTDPDSIMGTAFKASCVAKAGGGVGYYLGDVRPKGFPVKSVHRKACGPVAVLHYLHGLRNLITQGGKRDLAQMGVLNADHPDVMDWIHCKDEDPKSLESFNISVSWTDEQVRAALGVGRPADPKWKKVWDEQTHSAWRTGDPGMFFEDAVNRANATPHLGRVKAPNPCGETPNLNNEPCLTGDSLVETPGGLIPIRELLPLEEFSVTTYDQITVPGCRAIRRGVKPVLRVTLTNGQEVRCTENHKILTDGGWIRASRLRKGDMVRVADKQTIIPVVRESLEDEMLGWQLGDGWQTEAGGVGILFSADDEPARQRLMPVWDDFVGTDYALQVQPTGVVQKASSKAAVIDKFTGRGFKTAKATGKELPHYILTADAYRQQAFLRGLFSADGGLRKSSGTGERSLVNLSSSSEVLLRQVQVLLTRFGIQSRIRWSDFDKAEGRVRNDQGHLQISGQSSVRFMQVIGFNLPAKQQAYKPTDNTPRANPEYFPVASVEKAGEEEVYDVLMPAHHHFLANGVVVHNCNLGSLALLRFVNLRTRKIDWDKLAVAVGTAIEFLDHILDSNVFPHPDITAAALATRKLGLGVMGWADMLALMRIPYDSPAAVGLASFVMEFINGRALETSVRLAGEKGPYPAWESAPDDVKQRFPRARNSTRTSIAPTGTIAIFADCMSSIEPHFAMEWERKTNEGILIKEHIAVRDYLDGFVPKTADQVPLGFHVDHQAAFQRHTDLGVSKTINLPNSATVRDVGLAYRMMWELRCKGGTVFRDGCRDEQVLRAIKSSVYTADRATANGPPVPVERKMPQRRVGETVEARIGGFAVYLTMNKYEDGTLGEIWLKVAKNGSTLHGMNDAWAIQFSKSLQFGVPLERMAKWYSGLQTDPSGVTGDPVVPICTSIPDYVVRRLAAEFLVPKDPNAFQAVATGPIRAGDPVALVGGIPHVPATVKDMSKDAREWQELDNAFGATLPLMGAGPVQSGQYCPECSRQLYREAGCLTCPPHKGGCGYQKCG